MVVSYLITGELHQALVLLKQNLPKPGTIKKQTNFQVKSALLFGKWMQYPGYFRHEEILNHYNSLLDSQFEHQKLYFSFGRYYDSLLLSKQKHEKKLDLSRLVILHYGRSLMHGVQFIYQALPRLLTIWFEVSQNPEQVTFLAFVGLE